MLLQLIFAAVTLAAVGGALWSYNNGLRKEGEAKAVAEYEKQKRVQEEANALKALEGEKYALELLDKAEKRAKQLAAQQAVMQRQWSQQSETQAAKDLDYDFWRRQRVPDFSSSRLRDATKAVATDAPSNLLPSRAPIPAQSSVPAIAGQPVDELRLRELRTVFGFGPETRVAVR